MSGVAYLPKDDLAPYIYYDSDYSRKRAKTLNSTQTTRQNCIYSIKPLTYTRISIHVKRGTGKKKKKKGG